MEECNFCRPEIEPNQKVILSNDYCLFLQLGQSEIKGRQLEGAGLIVPKEHRETVFDLTKNEWEATYSLLQEVKLYIDNKHEPRGYNLGWNCGEVGGQHTFHAHFHVMPRYEDEPLAGKGIRYIMTAYRGTLKMIAIFTILIAILILDQFINRKLITKLNIEKSELGRKYVNKLHKYGERILYWTSFIVMIVAINEFPHLRILIFVGMAALFAFRTIMKWTFTRKRKTYLLSAITCVLFILGSVTYGVTDYFNVI